VRCSRSTRVLAIRCEPASPSAANASSPARPSVRARRTMSARASGP
jgi:hypothetical protein